MILRKMCNAAPLWFIEKFSRLFGKYYLLMELQVLTLVIFRFFFQCCPLVIYREIFKVILENIIYWKKLEGYPLWCYPFVIYREMFNAFWENIIYLWNYKFTACDFHKNFQCCPFVIYTEIFKAFWKILFIHGIARFTPCDFEKNVQCCPFVIYREIFKAFWKILFIDTITRFTPCDFQKNVQCCPLVNYREIFKAFWKILFIDTITKIFKDFWIYIEIFKAFWILFIDGIARFTPCDFEKNVQCCPLVIYREISMAFWKILFIDGITTFTPCDFHKNVQCCPLVIIYRNFSRLFEKYYLLMELQGLPLVILRKMCNAAPIVNL